MARRVNHKSLRGGVARATVKKTPRSSGPVAFGAVPSVAGSPPVRPLPAGSRAKVSGLAG